MDIILESIVGGPFVLYARASVMYEGRAYSTLELGNYLIVAKPDGSFAVHGASRVTPLNYQPPGGRITVDRDRITVTRGSEELLVNVELVHYIQLLNDWSDNNIVIARTERELCDKLAASLPLHFPATTFVKVQREARTDAGPCDLLCTDSLGVSWVFELKRTAININAINQVRKYVGQLADSGHSARGLVAAPRILKNAVKYAERHGVEYVRVEFDSR